MEKIVHIKAEPMYEEIYEETHSQDPSWEPLSNGLLKEEVKCEPTPLNTLKYESGYEVRQKDETIHEDHDVECKVEIHSSNSEEYNEEPSEQIRSLEPHHPRNGNLQWDSEKCIETETTDSYECDYCCKVYYDKSSLKFHILWYHIDPKCCPVCHKTYGGNLSLKSHMKYHHSVEQKYTCPQCLKRFRFKSQLTRHVVRHEKKHSCDRCSLKFFTIHELNQHLKLHLEIKDDTCSEKHMPVHSDMKPYLCTCGNQYHLKENLFKHLKYHQRGNYFQCAHCPMHFTRKATLYGHILGHNKGSSASFPYNFDDFF